MRYKTIKFKYLALFCTIFIISCNNDEVEPVDCVITVTEENKAYVEDKLFTGQCYVYASDGVIVRLRTYKRGILHGVQKAWYHPEETIAYIGHRRKGKIHGKYTGYHRNGSIQAEGKMRKGYYNGTWKYYDDIGTLIMEKSFYKGKAVDSTLIY